MSKDKKPQAGEWWIHDDSGEKAYFIGRCPDGIMVWQCEGDDIEHGNLDWSGWHHEPRCTGWEWQPEPQPEWFDLTPFGEHSLRKGIDLYEKNRDDVWLQIQVYEGATIDSMKSIWGHDQKFRCLLKDAPKELIKPVSPSEYAYGRCPICGARGKSRERRINGNDACENGHVYPSKDAIYGDSPIPSPKPATQTIVFHEVLNLIGIPDRYVMEWWSEIPSGSIPTGRTETREVVR